LKDVVFKKAWQEKGLSNFIASILQIGNPNDLIGWVGLARCSLSCNLYSILVVKAR